MQDPAGYHMSRETQVRREAFCVPLVQTLSFAPRILALGGRRTAADLHVNLEAKAETKFLVIKQSQHPRWMGGTPLVALIYLSRLEQPLWMGIQIVKLQYGCVIFRCHLDWQRVQPFGRWIAPAATGTLCWQLDVLSPLRAENRPGIQSPLGSDFCTLLLDLPHSCLVLQHAASQSGSSFQSTMVEEIKLYLKEKWKTFKIWWMILFRCKGKSAQNPGFCSFPPHKTGGFRQSFP